jgi:Uri superfamily endonuclease
MAQPVLASRRDTREGFSAQSAPPLNHLYVVAVWVPRREEIVVGSLGPVTFARHKRADKPLRWHADYLFSRHPATRSWLVDTIVTECELAALLRDTGGDAEGHGSAMGPASSRGEAAPAHVGALRATGEPGPADRARARTRQPAAPARFGAGDCGCRGHLVSMATAADLSRMAETLARCAVTPEPRLTKTSRTAGALT